MSDVIIIWDLPEDLDGNVQHIAAHHITVDEVEEVLLDRDSEDTSSRSSGMLYGVHSNAVAAKTRRGNSVWRRGSAERWTRLVAYEP